MLWLQIYIVSHRPTPLIFHTVRRLRIHLCPLPIPLTPSCRMLCRYSTSWLSNSISCNSAAGKRNESCIHRYPKGGQLEMNHGGIRKANQGGMTWTACKHFPGIGLLEEKLFFQQSDRLLGHMGEGLHPQRIGLCKWAPNRLQNNQTITLPNRIIQSSGWPSLFSMSIKTVILERK